MPELQTPPADHRLLYSLTDLQRRGIVISKSTLRRLEKAGAFPKRVYVGKHSVAWVALEVEAHIDALAAVREDVR